MDASPSSLTQRGPAGSHTNSNAAYNRILEELKVVLRVHGIVPIISGVIHILALYPALARSLPPPWIAYTVRPHEYMEII
jgi:hypothetical protein